MVFTHITDTTQQVAQLSVNIVVHFTDSSQKLGSGFLLDGKTVITAGHVVDNYDYEDSAFKTISYIEVIPAKDGSYEPYDDYAANLSSLTFWPAGRAL